VTRWIPNARPSPPESPITSVFIFIKALKSIIYIFPRLRREVRPRYSSGVERLTRADQACAVAAAALSHDFNSELTVILSSVSSAIATLEPGHPARPALLDLEGAARRCAYKCGNTLAFSLRHGVRPGRASLAAVLEL
jgi:hypothetical protein